MTKKPAEVDDHHELTRGVMAWRRERIRWPDLKVLRPGVRLVRMYKYRFVSVRVLRVGYVMDGVTYFTLAACVEALVPRYEVGRTGRPGTRVVASQSARRFFGDAVLGAVRDAA